MECTAFAGERRIASGDLRRVALEAKAALARDKWVQVVIFDDVTSNLIEVDLRGTADEVLERLAECRDQAITQPAEAEGHAPRGPGRPKLGVVAREVTLLPRHWEWLASQPGGASVALRKLVENARTANRSKDRLRTAQEAAYRFLSAMAGNAAGFEEAVRALFAGNREKFDHIVEPWPVDIRDHAKKVAAAAFAESGPLTAI